MFSKNNTKHRFSLKEVYVQSGSDTSTIEYLHHSFSAPTPAVSSDIQDRVHFTITKVVPRLPPATRGPCQYDNAPGAYAILWKALWLLPRYGNELDPVLGYIVPAGTPSDFDFRGSSVCTTTTKITNTPITDLTHRFSVAPPSPIGSRVCTVSSLFYTRGWNNFCMRIGKSQDIPL